VTELGVNPAAAVWPMLPDDELKTLAESIAAVGLLEPITLDVDGRVLDGRNRLAACELAGVEPSFVTTFAEPVAFVLAMNDARRHLSKGQRALAAWLTSTAAMDLPSTRGVASVAGVDQSLVVWAKAVADHGGELVGEVLDGTKPLRAAYDEAVAARDARHDDAVRLVELTAAAPDLSEAVARELMTLPEAMVALAKRRQVAAEERRDAAALLDRIAKLATVDGEALSGWVSRLDPDPGLIARTRTAIACLTELVDRLEGSE